MEKVQSICEMQNEGSGESWCWLIRVKSQSFHLAEHRCASGMSSAAGAGENEPAMLGLRGDSAEQLYR